MAQEAGRWRVIDPDQSWLSVRSLPGAILGYGILAISVAGTNQQPVQRYLTCRDVPGARRAAWTGWAVGLVVTALTLVVGVLLFAYHEVAATPGAGDLGPDAIFPRFIAEVLPPGVAGLLMAAIFAAAMSSLDSALNSLATATMHDFVLRYRRRPITPEAHLAWARAITVAWGIASVGAALYVAGQGTLLALVVRYMGYFAGPVLGLFVLALLPRRFRPTAALLGTSLAFASVLGFELLARSSESVAPLGIWACAVGALVTLVATVGLDAVARPGGEARRG